MNSKAIKEEAAKKAKKAQKEAIKIEKDKFNDAKERAEATVSFLPPQVIDTETRIEVRKGIQEAKNKEELSKYLIELYRKMEQKIGKEKAAKIIQGIIK